MLCHRCYCCIIVETNAMILLIMHPLISSNCMPHLPPCPCPSARVVCSAEWRNIGGLEGQGSDILPAINGQPDIVVFNGIDM